MEEKVKYFCQKWKIKEFYLFGSILNETFNDKSDVDVLVTFNDKSSYGLFELVEMKAELEQIFGREVDLLTKRGVEQSKNHIRRDSILNGAKLTYAER